MPNFSFFIIILFVSGNYHPEWSKTNTKKSKLKGFQKRLSKLVAWSLIVNKPMRFFISQKPGMGLKQCTFYWEQVFFHLLTSSKRMSSFRPRAKNSLNQPKVFSSCCCALFGKNDLWYSVNRRFMLSSTWENYKNNSFNDQWPTYILRWKKI